MLPEIVYAPTEDNWLLALHRYQPRKIRHKHPVLLVHGLGANRLNFDLDDRYSFARLLQACGFDTWIVELRGAGLTKPPQGKKRWNYQWGFADYAERDIPCSIATVLELSKARSLHGVGHSMGGM